MDMQISLQDPVLNSSGYIPRSGITRAYDNSMILLLAPSYRSGSTGKITFPGEKTQDPERVIIFRRSYNV